MELILTQIAFIAIGAASVCALFGLLFVETPKRLPMRVVTVALGATAMVLPVYSIYDTVGFPDPWPREGKYEVLGWKFDEARRAMYAFVKNPEENRPRLYKVDFDKQTALDLQEVRRNPEHVARIGMNVTPDAEGALQVAFELERRVVIRSLAEEEEERDQARQAAEARRAMLPESQGRTPSPGAAATSANGSKQDREEEEEDKK